MSAISRTTVWETDLQQKTFTQTATVLLALGFTVTTIQAILPPARIPKLRMLPTHTMH